MPCSGENNRRDMHAGSQHHIHIALPFTIQPGLIRDQSDPLALQTAETASASSTSRPVKVAPLRGTDAMHAAPVNVSL